MQLGVLDAVNNSSRSICGAGAGCVGMPPRSLRNGMLSQNQNGCWEDSITDSQSPA